jgi:glycosyltransferase involved in cell wall biosynthesis
MHGRGIKSKNGHLKGTNKMRIACLLRKGIFYGAENMTVLAATYMAKNHDVWYCCPEGPIQEYLKDTGVTHFPIDKVSVKTVRHVMKMLKPDIFLVLDNKASMVCALAGVPFVSYQQNNWPFIGKLNIFTLGMLYYCKHAKRVIGVSDHFIKEYIFSKYVRDKYITIPNVVDLSHVKELAGELPQTKTYDLCFFGRLSEQKYPESFVHIVKKIVETRPETNAVMVGHGELTDKVKALAAQLNVLDKITFTGFLKNPFEIIKRSRLLVMTSRYEGKCLAVIEAMSLGLPIIARRVPGLEDDVDDSCGVLCDNEEEFCTAILELLADDDLYKKKSQGAIERSRVSGDVEKFVADIEKVCVEAVGV